MTLTRNELVLLSNPHTDVLRIIIIINIQYRYVFVSYIINPLALRARSATMWYMIIHNCTVRIRISGSERSERGCDQYILWPYGGNICITYIKVVLRHFCHFFTRLSNPLVRYAHSFVVPSLTRVGHIASATRGKLVLINPWTPVAINWCSSWVPLAHLRSV